jgi:hypothetical protein
MFPSMSFVNRYYKEIYDRILIVFPSVFFKREGLKNWEHLRVFVVDVLFSNITIDNTINSTEDSSPKDGLQTVSN